MKDLTKVKDNLSNMIAKVEVKPDLTPQEVENVKCAAEALYKIQICEAMDKDNGAMYGTAPYHHDMHDMDMYGRRSRDSMGRYTGGGDQNGNYNAGYGAGMNHMYGHSIKDRMIDNLEQMMNSTNGEYERQQIAQEIDRLRSGR